MVHGGEGVSVPRLWFGMATAVKRSSGSEKHPGRSTQLVTADDRCPTELPPALLSIVLCEYSGRYRDDPRVYGKLRLA